MNTLIAQIERESLSLKKFRVIFIYVLFVMGLSRQCRSFYFRVFFC